MLPIFFTLGKYSSVCQVKYFLCTGIWLVCPDYIHCWSGVRNHCFQEVESAAQQHDHDTAGNHDDSTLLAACTLYTGASSVAVFMNCYSVSCFCHSGDKNIQDCTYGLLQGGACHSRSYSGKHAICAVMGGNWDSVLNENHQAFLECYYYYVLNYSLIQIPTAVSGGLIWCLCFIELRRQKIVINVL